MVYLSKMVIFHCYVSSPEGISFYISKASKNPSLRGIKIFARMDDHPLAKDPKDPRVSGHGWGTSHFSTHKMTYFDIYYHIISY